MKRPAVVTFLPEKHLGALDAFLSRYGRLRILTPAANHSPALDAIARRHRCRITTLESLLPPEYDAAQEAGAVVEALRPHAEATGAPGAIVDEQMRASVPVAVELADALGAAGRRFELVLFATHEDVTATNRSATAWAAAHAVPSLHLAHSLALTDPYTVHAHLEADVLAVYGERGAEGYLDLGVAPDRIVVTGNPSWDQYAAMRGRRAAIRADLDARYGLDPDLPLVVFATTWSAHLTAFDPGDTHAESLAHFFGACARLARDGVHVNAVVKDRPANQAFGRASFDDAVPDSPDGQHYHYALADGEAFASAADVVVGVDSNYLVEAMIAGSSAVNLVGWSAAPMAPAFDALSGVVEVEPDQLAGALRRLLEDEQFRAEQLALASSRLSYYHLGGADGQAGERVGELMAAMARPRPAPPAPTVRQRSRRVAERAAQRIRRAVHVVVGQVREQR